MLRFICTLSGGHRWILSDTRAPVFFGSDRRYVWVCEKCGSKEVTFSKDEPNGKAS